MYYTVPVQHNHIGKLLYHVVWWILTRIFEGNCCFPLQST